MEATSSLNFAGFWIRGVAYGIDSIIVMLVSLAVNVVTGYGTVLSLSIMTGLYAVYYIATLSSPWQGGIGKRLLKLYVCTKEGKQLTVLHATARYVAFIIPSIPSTVVSFINSDSMKALIEAYMSQDFYAIQQANADFAPMIQTSVVASFFGTILLLVWFLPAAFTKQKTGLHDLMCKTRVVHGRPASAKTLM